MRYGRLLGWVVLALIGCSNAWAQDVNLSLWNGADTQRKDSTRYSWLNVGLCSKMYEVNGLSANVFAGVVNRNIRGVQVSGLANVVGDRMLGCQVAGICNVNRRYMAGVSASGLVTVNSNLTDGMALSGALLVSGGRMRGVAVGGLMNVMGRNSYGAMVAGMANVLMGASAGVGVSGLATVVGQDAEGFWLAGLGNIAGKSQKGLVASGLLSACGNDMWGVQMSGGANYVEGTVHGAQMSILNVANRLKGVQLGLVNYKKEESGFQLGLANLSPSTVYQCMIFGGNNAKANVAVRFRGDLFYTMLGVGSNYLEVDRKYSASVFYRAGMWKRVWKGLSVTGDVGYQHVETFRNRFEEGIPARLYALQLRVGLEYEISRHFGIFAAGGYGWDRYYNRSGNFGYKAIGELGIILQ